MRQRHRAVTILRSCSEILLCGALKFGNLLIASDIACGAHGRTDARADLRQEGIVALDFAKGFRCVSIPPA
ncbi:hypothetical protein SPHINGOAX6_30066 [Sphingomonas sp. AX6]|nr:hypothetical protein SPHINGOAX6_30066 [Sphingomonas sp. AX6]